MNPIPYLVLFVLELGVILILAATDFACFFGTKWTGTEADLREYERSRTRKGIITASAIMVIIAVVTLVWVLVTGVVYALTNH